MPSYSSRLPMRSHFDAQVDFFSELARAGIDALRRLSELNVQLARQLNDDALHAARAMVSCSYPFQLPVVAASESAPFIEHLRSYQQQLAAVLSGAQVELARSAGSRLPGISRAAAATLGGMARRDAGTAHSLARPAGDSAVSAARPPHETNHTPE
ncbi:phasin family protein [Massilia violaceinigra]|nr:phasin family protein [Massilia violaceinigra]